MVSYELRQAWKGATVIVKSCAGVWLAGNSTFSFLSIIYKALILTPSFGEANRAASILINFVFMK
jgi:hypothetical protein